MLTVDLFKNGLITRHPPVMAFVFTDNYTEYECDQCPAACSSENYAVQLSYASNSRLSLDGLRAEQRDSVLHEFHTAVNTKHRLNRDDIFTNVNILQEVILSLQETMSIISNKARNTHAHLEGAVTMLLDDARKDINEVLLGKIDAWVDAYDSNLKPRKWLYDMLDDAVESLNSMIIQLTAIDTNVTRYIRSDLFDQMRDSSAILSPKYRDDLLFDIVDEHSRKLEKLITAISHLLLYYQETVDTLVKDQLQENVPSRLIYDQEKLDNKVCYTSTIEVYHTSVKILQLIGRLKAAYNSSTNHTDLLRHQDMEELRATVEYFETQSRSAQTCLAEYRGYLDQIVIWQEQMHFSPFNYSDILDSHVDQDIFMKHIEDMDERYAAYLEHQHNTQYLFGKFATGYNIRVITDLETWRTGLQQILLVPMKTSLRTIEQEVNSYYTVGLKKQAKLAVYFGKQSSELLRATQNMLIWRKPYATLDHHGIIRHRLTPNEGRSAVPENVETFIEEQAERVVAENLNDTFEGLVKVIDDLDESLVSTIKDLQVSFNHIGAIMEEFEGKHQTGEAFVK